MKKNINFIILLIIIIIVIVFKIQERESRFEETNGYDKSTVGIIVRSCYSAAGRNKYIDYRFNYLEKNYTGSKRILYEECGKYHIKDSVLIEFSSKYPYEFNNVISIIY